MAIYGVRCVPQGLFVVSGRDDAYAASPAHEAVITAARPHEVAAPSCTDALDVLGQALLRVRALHSAGGYDETHASRSGNLDGVTGDFRRYHATTRPRAATITVQRRSPCSDDHFVYTCSADARADYFGFLGAVGSAPVVPAGP